MIAETTDLPTKLAKIVVTDDQGRYLMPELPKAKYKVWVRGYGLVDSPKVDAEPGKLLDLTAVKAPNEAAAAQYYPPIYWYSMLKVPAEERSSRLDQGERARPHWLNDIKTTGCMSCHALGTLGTRTIPKELRRIQELGRGVGAAHPVGTGVDPDGHGRRPARHAACARAVGRLDRPRSRPASCRSTSRRGRRASSATSCSRCGTGARPPPTCTT